MELEKAQYEKLLSKPIYLLSFIDVFFKRWFLLDQTTVHKKETSPGIDVFFSYQHFPIVSGFKTVF